jgi:hypothetical protein
MKWLLGYITTLFQLQILHTLNMKGTCYELRINEDTEKGGLRIFLFQFLGVESVTWNAGLERGRYIKLICTNNTQANNKFSRECARRWGNRNERHRPLGFQNALSWTAPKSRGRSCSGWNLIHISVQYLE